MRNEETIKEWYERTTGQSIGQLTLQGACIRNGLPTEPSRIMTETEYYLKTEDGKYLETE